jgi:hypothetical protein
MTRPPNNEMKRTSHGQDGGSPLISVFYGRWTMEHWRTMRGFSLLAGALVGGSVGWLCRWHFADPLAQSASAMLVGWACGSLAPAALWLKFPPRDIDVLAVSFDGLKFALGLLTTGMLGALIHLATPMLLQDQVWATEGRVALGAIGGIIGAAAFGGRVGAARPFK